MVPILSIAIRHRLRSFSLDVSIETGEETLALIGPSGAGKTSVLRVVAGLMHPDWARVVSNGRELVDTDSSIWMQPEQRRIGMVFQDGALFPNMTVAQNVAYGLHPRPRRRHERKARVHELLERFRIPALGASRPATLSGGERQRVALARAVATSPEVLLLDEPLSALDSSTRAHVAGELTHWLSELRLPTVLVSHDLTDVLGLADRIAVIEEGRIVQSGTPTELLQAPASSFVAAFVGVNYFKGRAGHDGHTTVIDVGDGAARLFSTQEVQGYVGVIVDPWDVTLSASRPESSALNVLSGPISRIVESGNIVRVTVDSDPPVVSEITRDSTGRLELAVGKQMHAFWKAAGTRLVPRDELDEAQREARGEYEERREGQREGRRERSPS